MTENDLRAVRAAQNQSLFREINARLVSLNETFETFTDRSVFVCECAAIACVEEVDIALRDYARIRSNPRRFVVAPSDDHVVPDVERIVERQRTFFVVEKVGVGAAVAEQAATHR
jgi:hypothetical protein